MSEKNFYRNLRLRNASLVELFHTENFSQVPADWHIVISDIINSTAAVNEGRHNDVNLVAAGSLIVSLNIARMHDVEIPFFFGGDGGTVILPGEMLDDVLTSLKAHNENSRANFNLEMHIGSMSVADVNQAGHTVLMTKMSLGKGFSKALVVGDGLKFAEQRIKANLNDVLSQEDADLNLEGLECRWNRVKPPAEENEIVCYLIEATQPQEQITVYRDVIRKIDELYGPVEKRNPLSVSKLKLQVSLQKIRKETVARFGQLKIGYLLNTLLFTFLGKFYFRYNLKANELRGQEYLRQLITNADTLTIDGRINTIISGSMEKRIDLLRYLSVEEEKGRLIFGYHISKESVMTCYIQNRDQKHIHFVDGADGGYTEAAKVFKSKRNKTNGAAQVLLKNT